MALSMDFRLGKGANISKSFSDRGLVFHLALLVVPVAVGLCLLGFWLGNRAGSGTLKEAVALLPRAEVAFQADRMTDILSKVRNGLFRLAQTRNLDAQTLREGLDSSFRESLDYIAEVGLSRDDGKGFLFLRDKGEMWEVSPEEAYAGPYAALQQSASLSLQAGRVHLLPAVLIHYPANKSAPHSLRKAVMRMVLPLDDGSGVLMAGIDLQAMPKALGMAGAPDSPLGLLVREGDHRLSFFFDLRGWILFESGGQEIFPNSVRAGYSGDLARPGYDAAFRPWAVHEDYWRMVIDVSEKRGGGTQTSAAHYSPEHSGYPAFLCWAPVLFSPAEGRPAEPVAGIALFETSSLLLSVFLRGANTMLIFVPLALAVLLILVLWAGRCISRPLRSISAQMEQMGAGGEFAALEVPPACEEHQVLQAAANSVVTRAMSLHSDLERLSREMDMARASRPVDLRDTVVTPSFNEELGLVGSGRAIREIREQIRKAARAGTDVLVFGETGTGKELVAEAIHKAGARSKGPFISINCGALDENLLLDTLFGHVKGAFSEAVADRRGAFLAADGGTLHLDEIANASPKVQQSLLRALSVRRVRPLGTDHEIPFNTRVVAATNVDLRDSARDGRFREDLYYRLAIISIETPPLRERKEDIPELAAFCLHEAARSMGRPDLRVSRGALEFMTTHDWPGNVREFKNCLTRAMAFADGDILLRRHINLKQNANGSAGEQSAYDAPEREVARYASDAAPLSPARDDDFGASLNERQTKAMRLLRGGDGFSRAEYEAAAGAEVSSRTAQNDLRELVELGILRKRGAGPGTRYFVAG